MDDPWGVEKEVSVHHNCYSYTTCINGLHKEVLFGKPWSVLPSFCFAYYNKMYNCHRRTEIAERRRLGNRRWRESSHGTAYAALIVPLQINHHRAITNNNTTN